MNPTRSIFMETWIAGDDLAAVNRVLAYHGLPPRAEPGTLTDVMRNFLPLDAGRAGHLLRALGEALGDVDNEIT